VLVLWGSRGKPKEWYAVLDIWRSRANEVRGRALECGHYLPEEAPGKTYSELRAFFEVGAPGQSASL
jgi:haloacetate dehalogenase